MRKAASETIEEWHERVASSEVVTARRSIAAGIDPSTVLDTMSTRIISKLSHPLYAILRAEGVSNYDADVSIAEYKKSYLDKMARPADHVIK